MFKNIIVIVLTINTLLALVNWTFFGHFYECQNIWHENNELYVSYNKDNQELFIVTHGDKDGGYLKDIDFVVANEVCNREIKQVRVICCYPGNHHDLCLQRNPC